MRTALRPYAAAHGRAARSSGIVRHIVCVLAVALCLAAPLAAQAPADSVLRRQQRQIDSLLASVRALQARIDSLARRGDTTTGSDLDVLRAAAAAAAGAAADTTQRLIGRNTGGRNPNAYNPEISVTGDVRSALVRPGPQNQTFVLKEMELGFQSALDPFSVTKIFMGVGENDISVEEAYVYWTGLPGHLRLDLGKFRQQVGELNRWHLHAVPEGEYPLVLQRFLGEEGLAQTGVSLYWPLPISGPLGTFELTTQVTRGTDEVLFGRYGGLPTYSGQLSGFWQFSRSTYGQLSVSGLAGDGADSALVTPPPCTAPGCTTPAPAMASQCIQSRLGAIAARFSWRPPSEALRREVTIRGELFALQRVVDGVGPTRLGWYVDAQTKLGGRWIAAVRFDRVASTDPVAPGHEWAVTPTLTFWQSEFVFLRAQWTHHRDVLAATTDRLGLQVVWSIGPHRHEIF